MIIKSVYLELNNRVPLVYFLNSKFLDSSGVQCGVEAGLEAQVGFQLLWKGLSQRPLTFMTCKQ